MTIIGNRNPVPAKWVPAYKLGMNLAGFIIGAIWISAGIMIIDLFI